ncbi:hypothetical protein SAMN05443247_05932 [Bradyrhizobium erythrophlei]|jgi:hypothetical protein|nr:hypothetical protein SAMN05443247_05932 [Bradyrhizobium erythrophlei]
MNWIEKEFRRTGLPRSALARYLDRQNPVVSLIASGDRQVTAEEADLIRSFFSIVPPNASPEFTSAVEVLKSTKLRKRIGIDLLRGFERDASQVGPGLAWSLASLLEPLNERTSILRADQIVAICRIAWLDLGSVTGGARAGVIVQGQRKRLDDALSELNASAKLWMTDCGSPRAYEFDRGGRFEPIPVRTQNIQKAGLQFIDSSIFDLGKCTGFIVVDDNAKPFFVKGQTIFVSHTKPQPGDLVAVINEQELSGDTAVIGKLAYESSDAIAIDTARGQQKLEKTSYLQVRRIDFCRL